MESAREWNRRGRTQIESDVKEQRLMGACVDIRERNRMGMGLAIVRSIIASHDGELAAENADGGGACVHFSLPIIVKGRGG